MIRFMPDTWWDALLRPFAMADPNGWVYVELLAPDFRFALAILLALLVAGMLLAKRIPDSRLRPVITVFIVLFASFIPWLLTTGNGRYFMPYIIVIGPLCVGLIYLLPSTRSMRASLAVVALGLQGFALYQNSPWTPFGSWGFIDWKEAPYFSLNIAPEDIRGDETFVTLPNMTFSAVAPLFPDSVRWVNLSTFNGVDVETDTQNYQPVREMLNSAKNLRLFQKAQPHEMAEGSVQPSEKAVSEINAYLHPHKLALTEPPNCRLMRSASVARHTMVPTNVDSDDKARLLANSGFWICPLVYPAKVPKAADLTKNQMRAIEVLGKMEQVCPRFFAPGQKLVGRYAEGYARSYSSSDSTLIWTRNDEVWVQNARSLTPERIGSAEEVLSPNFSFDCTRFRGRAGLPWEREI